MLLYAIPPLLRRVIEKDRPDQLPQPRHFTCIVQEHVVAPKMIRAVTAILSQPTPDTLERTTNFLFQIFRFFKRPKYEYTIS